VAGAFKIEPDLGEISVGRSLGRLANGNHSFEVSATNGLHTVAGAFKIEPDIGEISVGRSLGRLANGNHSFEVSATNGLHTAQTVVTVRLDTRKNRNEAVPRFEKSRYVFRIEENRPPSVVGVVRAYHVALSSRDVSLRYELINDYGNPTPPFRVHGISGEVTSETTLDHEENKNYEFKIRACLSVNPTNYVFGIDYHTGVVQTIASLSESLYELNVEAFDHGDPKRTEVMKLIISVHGTNPSAPVFEQKRYEVTVISPVRAGAVVAEVHAKDPDPGPEGQTGVVSALEHLTANDGPFDLVIIAEDQSSIFKRKKRYEVTVTSPVRAGAVVAEVHAKDPDPGPEGQTSAILHIDIIGDMSLKFFPLPSTIYISTEKAVGSVVLRASAFTSTSMPVHFRILENDAPFVMDGDLLRVASHLSAGETNLTVRAETENAHSDHRLKVVVMFDRDKYPVFPQLTYDIDIPIDSMFPLIAHRFDAHLLNGTLRYRFFPDGTAPQGLHIHPNTGELSVTSDYVNTPSNHDTQFVVVRAVNLNFPEFYSDVGVAISLVSSKTIRFSQTIYRMQLTENTPIGTALFPPIEVASHLSAGETNLTVRAETENAHSDHRLKVVVMFDRDKYPVFPQLTYDIDIPIDSMFPLIAHRFDAHLLNGTLRYRFFPDGTAPQGLHIHPNTGELSVTSDYVNTPSNHDTQFVVVRAVNLNFPEFYSDVGVAISLVSSKTIRFSQTIYRMQLTENTPIGTALFPPIEVFPKSSGVTYSINPPTPLSILPNGTLVVNSAIDLETLSVDSSGSLHFVVTAASGSTEASTKLQLKIKDLNEFAPQFESALYEASIDEDAIPGSVITQVRATDADKTEGTHLLYRIAGG
ncbi:unnamed protein product, partial [Strongylus vulgaris]